MYFCLFIITAGTSGGVLKHENTVVHVDPNAAVAVKTSSGTVITLNNAGNASNPASAGASPAPPASTAEIQSFLNHQAAGHIQQRNAAAAPTSQINVSGEGENILIWEKEFINNPLQSFIVIVFQYNPKFSP